MFLKNNDDSNALANARRRLIGQLHKLVTVYPNRTLLRNVAYHWLTSDYMYMQLASCFMQLAAVGRRRRNKVHFHCRFEGKML